MSIEIDANCPKCGKGVLATNASPSWIFQCGCGLDGMIIITGGLTIEKATEEYKRFVAGKKETENAN